MPITHTGNWEWRSGLTSSAVPSGDCASNPMTCTSFWFGNTTDLTSWGFGYDGFNHLSLAAHFGTLEFPWSTSALFLDGVLTDPLNLPVGFQVRDAYHFAIGTSGPPASSNMELRMEFTTLAFDETIFDFGVAHIIDLVGMNLLALLSIGGWQFKFTGSCPAFPTWPGQEFRLANSAPPKFYGVFDIIVYWWKLPDVTPCGDKNTTSDRDSRSHLIYSGDQPPTPEGAFGEYEYFDPDDPIDGAPQPVIYSVEPNHGQAGTRVTIMGDGFGDDANVQFDGVDAEDIEVVSRYQVRATAPLHALGFANIAVINVDGVSS